MTKILDFRIKGYDKENEAGNNTIVKLKATEISPLETMSAILTGLKCTLESDGLNFYDGLALFLVSNDNFDFNDFCKAFDGLLSEFKEEKKNGKRDSKRKTKI